jgi:hypothetical protein
MVERMKTSDLVLVYPLGTGSRKKGICRLRSFATAKGQVVLLTDLGDKNTGMSVTNAIEEVVDAALRQGLVASGATFIEHYERDDFQRSTFDLVTFSSAGSPNWNSIPISQVLSLTGCARSELEASTSSDTRLVGEIDRVRQSIDPFVDSPYLERPEIVNRRAEIAAGMIAKDRVANLVADGAKEQDIQRLLKQDLSIFGELYASPKDEYICFSEFPVADGFVDFAVFTGRSRMDVILIEVKGADFDLVNGDAYGAFARPIDKATDQIRNRLGYVYRNILEFGSEVHRIRKIAEGGRAIHNSFLGPLSKLGVDPNKDINIRTVVIGGRTRNDREESKKRHDYEFTFSPPIKIESWDTWLRKFQRR